MPHDRLGGPWSLAGRRIPFYDPNVASMLINALSSLARATRRRRPLLSVGTPPGGWLPHGASWHLNSYNLHQPSTCGPKARLITSLLSCAFQQLFSLDVGGVQCELHPSSTLRDPRRGIGAGIAKTCHGMGRSQQLLGC